MQAHLDLVPYELWPQVQAAGVKMSCVLPEMGIAGAQPFDRSFNWIADAPKVHAALNDALDRAKAADIPYIIVFTGMSTGEERNVQFDRIVDGYTTPFGDATESLVAKAERLGITFIIEMLNTVGDPAQWWGHPGNLGKNTRELVEQVVKKIGSPNFQLAFDLYHCGMMGEDIAMLIYELHQFIGYVHLAGKFAGAVNRAELTLPGQVIDYPGAGAALAKYIPERQLFALAEWIPSITNDAAVDLNIRTSFALLESQIT